MPGGNGGRLVGFEQADGIVIWFVWSVSFVWLNETNQMNQINQTNKTNQINQTDHAQAGCGGAERGRTAASQFCRLLP
jgi:hypothetical protein